MASSDGQAGMSGVLRDLSDMELRLVTAARDGTELKCSSLTPDQLANSQKVAHLIRAELIRELLLGRHGLLDPRGVQLRGARITGAFDLDYVHATTGLHLMSCACDEPIAARDARIPRLYLSGTHVRGIYGDGLQVDGDMFLDEKFTATSNSKGGTIALRGARIGHQFNLTDAHLTNQDGPALAGDGLRVDGDMFMDDNFTATSNYANGTIRLLGAHIGGQLSCKTAQLTNQNGPALAGDGLQVTEDLFVDEGFIATGKGELGAVRLPGAHIGGEFKLTGARLTNQDGPALLGDRLQVDGSVFLDELITTGNDEDGAVRLPGVRIGGKLRLNEAKLMNSNSSGLILTVENAHVNSMAFPSGVVCPSSADTPSKCSAATKRIDVGGLTYTSLVDVSWQQWLHLLRRHTAHYMPMPYQVLANQQKAAGHDRDARRILVAQQDDLRARGKIGGWFPRAVHWLWGKLAGYGYRAGRVACALLIVLGVAAGMGWWAGHTVTAPGQHAAQHTKASADPGSACSSLEQIGLGIDRGLPIGSTGIRTYCDLNTASPAGEVFTFVIWTLQALVWALATLAVAGYTGLIRKIT